MTTGQPFFSEGFFADGFFAEGFWGEQSSLIISARRSGIIHWPKHRTNPLPLDPDEDEIILPEFREPLPHRKPSLASSPHRQRARKIRDDDLILFF